MRNPATLRSSLPWDEFASVPGRAYRRNIENLRYFLAFERKCFPSLAFSTSVLARFSPVSSFLGYAVFDSSLSFTDIIPTSLSFIEIFAILFICVINFVATKFRSFDVSMILLHDVRWIRLIYDSGPLCIRFNVWIFATSLHKINVNVNKIQTNNYLLETHWGSLKVG